MSTESQQHCVENQQLKADQIKLVNEINIERKESAIQLAAEQQKRADWNFVIEDLERQLAAERQRTQTVGEQLDSYVLTVTRLEQQLLSAQAAIEKHNTDHVDDSFCCIDVDLSLLHQHDAEVRKPLVDALLLVASCKALHRCTCPAVASDALANVKEGK